MAKRKSRDQKRQQKVRQKQRREAKRNSPSALVARAAEGELVDCRISAAWDHRVQLTQILIARTIDAQRLGFAVFLVDQACLGVKDAYFRVGAPGVYRRIRDDVHSTQPLVPCAPALAAKVIRDAKAYAEDLGFSPHPNALLALSLLADADPDTCDQEVPLGGPEDKPLFIAGPHDNISAITAQLRERLGGDGFDFILPADAF
jgi:hypothetical protein